jgi:hypothetical protein
MSESTYQKDQRTPGDPQITGGGGHEPDPEDAAGTGGVGGHADRQGSPGPDGGTPLDLKSGDLPDATPT